MAFGDGSIGNQTGIGQGLAYILPQTKSEDYALKLAQDESHQIAANAAAALKRQQALQDGIQKQMAATKLPTIYAPFNKIINDNNTNWLKKSADYFATTGKSPFINPDLVSEREANVNALAKRSTEIGDKYSKGYAMAVADGGKKYMDEDIQKWMGLEKDIISNPQDYLDGKKEFPQLRLKPADQDAFDKLITPTTVTGKTSNGTVTTGYTKADRPAIVTQITKEATANPDKWQPLLSKYDVNLLQPTFPILNKQGRPVYSTKPETVDYLAQRVMESPQRNETLKLFGIPDDAYAEEALKKNIIRQNSGWGKFVSNTADNIASKAQTSSSYDYDNWREKQALNDKYVRGRKGTEDDTGDIAVTSRDFVSDPMNEDGDIVGLDDKGGKRKPLFTAKKFVPVNPISLGTGTIENAFNVNTGKNMPLPSTSSIEVVGIAEVPLEGQKGKTEIRISLVDGKGNEYIVPERNIPVKTRNDKNYVASMNAIKGIKPKVAEDKKKSSTVTNKFKGVPKNGF